MGLKCTEIDSQEPFMVFELSACKNSAELSTESGCKANDHLIRNKVDTACRSTLCRATGIRNHCLQGRD